MIVLDASAALEFLLPTERGAQVAALLEAGETLHAPHLLDLEVAQVLRRWVREGAVEPRRATAMLSDLTDLAVTRYAHTALLPRVWELRGHATAYDAAYLALAEALPATVVTCDARMAGVRGVRAAVRVL